jgi:hypothetical protein
MAARALMIALAYLVAAIVATVTFAILVFAAALQSWPPVPAMRDAAVVAVVTAPVAFMCFAIFPLLPSIIVALIAEAYGARSLVFYVLAAGVVTIVSLFGFRLSFVAFHPNYRGPMISSFYNVDWSLVVIGAIGGLVYWAIAGRNAGAWRTAKAAQAV